MKKGRINEIFYSYQGEGPYHGDAQIFIRFSGCNIKCAYCDTDHGCGMDFTCDAVVKEVESIREGRKIHSISITGGEPLCQFEFLRELLPKLKKKEYKIYLETNGILVEELKKLSRYVDIVAMDFKLPSCTGGKAFWREHEKFLKTGLKADDIFVKVVFSDGTILEDIEKAAEIIKRNAPDVKFILQPVTPFGGCESPSKEKINECYNVAKRSLKKVYVIPQLHKLLGIK